MYEQQKITANIIRDMVENREQKSCDDENDVNQTKMAKEFDWKNIEYIEKKKKKGYTCNSNYTNTMA